jgi:hypothetical protein
MKYKLIKDYNYNTMYVLYVKKFFWWQYLLMFSARNDQEAIDITREKVLAHLFPIVEFKL